MLDEDYQAYRIQFQYYRKLCDIGKVLKLIYPFLKPEEKKEVEDRYHKEDVIWLRVFLKNRGFE